MGSNPGQVKARIALRSFRFELPKYREIGMERVVEASWFHTQQAGFPQGRVVNYYLYTAGWPRRDV
jgi:hypothetical protein